MATYLTIQIQSGSLSVQDMSQVLQNGDDTKPHEIMEGIINLLTAIDSGARPGSLVGYSSDVAGTVSGQTGGVNVVVNLL